MPGVCALWSPTYGWLGADSRALSALVPCGAGSATSCWLHDKVLRRAPHHVGLSMRSAGRLGRKMCLDSVGMHNICDSCMHLGTCREVARSPLCELGLELELEMTLQSWWD